MSDTILVSKAHGVAEITLNRPDKLNSFNDEMHMAFRIALEDARDDAACRTVLLTGAGRGFCAGQDLGDRDPAKMDGPPDLQDTISRFYNPLVMLIRAMNKPVICAVNGVAAGAGANIALACDMVFAAESAKFIQSFAKVGLVPDSGGTWMLPRLIGEARAKAIALTATPVGAQQAMDWGMIWQAVPDAELMNVARAQAATFGEGPTFGLGSIKTAMHAGATQSLEEQLALEAEMQLRCGRSHDYAEGVSAFLSKRKPAFKGTED